MLLYYCCALSWVVNGALAQEWSNFMSNKIYEEQKELDRGFHLYGYTDRIAVYGPRPSTGRLIGKRRIVKDPRLMTARDHVPAFVPISYCALCNDYGVLYEHEQYEDNSDPLDYDNCSDTIDYLGREHRSNIEA